MDRSSAEHEYERPEALQAALAKLDQELAAGQAHIHERRARRHAAAGALKSARAQASDLSWELEDLEQRLRDLTAQREGPGDPLLDRELASITTRRAEQEERVLAQLLLVDELMARVAAEEQALADEERAWASHQRELAVERDRIANQLSDHGAAE
jgi:predicted  nucleic acid-binding Zn-ribbon protein